MDNLYIFENIEIKNAPISRDGIFITFFSFLITSRNRSGIPSTNSHATPTSDINCN